MQRPIQGFSVSPAVNNNITSDVLFSDNLLKEHSDTISSRSSSSSSSDSSSESDSDEDSQADSHQDSEDQKQEGVTQFDDVFSFKDDQDNPQPQSSPDNNFTKKKTASIKVQLTCGKIRNVHDVDKKRKGRKVGSNKVECEQCGKRITKRHLLHHKRTVHNYVTVKCGHCGKQVRKHYLMQHIQDVHKPKPKPKCDVCQKEISMSNLARHRKTHKPKPKCDVCQKEISLSNLARHRKTHRKEFIEALTV